VQGRTRGAAVVVASLFLLAGSAEAARRRGGEAEGSCHALIVSGLPGSPVYAKRYRDWTKRFHYYFTRTVGFPAENVVVLSGDEAFTDEIVKEKATKESIRRALEVAAFKVKPEDQFVLVLVGHGVITANPPTFVVPGPDPNAAEMGKLLDEVRARNQAVLNFTASAGASVPHFAGAGRVNIAANSPAEGNEPIFCEFFLRGLESKRADGMGAPEAGRRDGIVTVLEAYNWATWETAQWISRQSYVQGGLWRLDGRESVEVFKKLCSGPKDALGARRLAPGSSKTSPDATVRIKPEKYLTMDWATRRVLSERASLEDCGEKIPISALLSWRVPERPGEEVDADPAEEETFKKGYEPLAGTEKGEPGHLARRVVLGSPRLAPGR
jgi:hypothetical protein